MKSLRQCSSPELITRSTWALLISASLAATLATGLILAALKWLGPLPVSLIGVWPYLMGIGALAFPAYSCRISVERDTPAHIPTLLHRGIGKDRPRLRS